MRQFVSFLERAAAGPAGSRDRGGLLDRAGHLMYASHFSYTNDAMLGCDECDLLVQLVRDRERAGLYGARITGGGSGGTVAVLADEGAAPTPRSSRSRPSTSGRPVEKPRYSPGQARGPGKWGRPWLMPWLRPWG